MHLLEGPIYNILQSCDGKLERNGEGRSPAGFEPMTFRFVGWRSICCATTTAAMSFKNVLTVLSNLKLLTTPNKNYSIVQPARRYGAKIAPVNLSGLRSRSGRDI